MEEQRLKKDSIIFKYVLTIFFNLLSLILFIWIWLIAFRLWKMFKKKKSLTIGQKYFDTFSNDIRIVSEPLRNNNTRRNAQARRYDRHGRRLVGSERNNTKPNSLNVSDIQALENAKGI